MKKSDEDFETKIIEDPMEVIPAHIRITGPTYYNRKIKSTSNKIDQRILKELEERASDD